MRAVILAAGAGNRLRPVLGPWPKCLMPIGDATLLERQMAALADCGISAITVVAGYQAAAVATLCGKGVDVVINREFASTNSLYSLWLAREALAGGFVVLNSDVLFHPGLLQKLLDAPWDNALLMSPRTPETRYSDEEMKVHVREGCVAAIDKTLDPALADGENVGIARFSASGAAALVAEADAVVAAGGLREWLPRAFDRFCRRHPLHVISTGADPWIEIDFPEDYERACRDVLPAIDADVTAVTRAPRVSRATVVSSSGRVFHRV